MKINKTEICRKITFANPRNETKKAFKRHTIFIHRN